MTIFENVKLDGPDWKIFQNGWIGLYWKTSILEEDINWLTHHNYQIQSFDCKKWLSSKEALNDLGTKLQFPDYYGQNLNAFNDCLGNLNISGKGGIVLVFNRYDYFVDIDKSLAQAILDICSDNARRFMLFGKRLLTLVQSNDPKISFEPVGATPVIWNSREWFNKSRRT